MNSNIFLNLGGLIRNLELEIQVILDSIKSLANKQYPYNKAE